MMVHLLFFGTRECFRATVKQLNPQVNFLVASSIRRICHLCWIYYDEKKSLNLQLLEEMSFNELCTAWRNEVETFLFRLSPASSNRSKKNICWPDGDWASGMAHGIPGKAETAEEETARKMSVSSRTWNLFLGDADVELRDAKQCYRGTLGRTNLTWHSRMGGVWHGHRRSGRWHFQFCWPSTAACRDTKRQDTLLGHSETTTIIQCAQQLLLANMVLKVSLHWPTTCLYETRYWILAHPEN